MRFKENETIAPCLLQAFAAGVSLTKPALVCVQIKVIGSPERQLGGGLLCYRMATAEEKQDMTHLLSS